MHIVLVADGRSPIAIRWIQGMQALGTRVTLVSTYPCQVVEGLEGLHILPVAFGLMGGSQAGGACSARAPSPSGLRLVSRARKALSGRALLAGPADPGPLWRAPA